MTYASERGFKVGEKYTVTSGGHKGRIVELIRDDGTDVPLFRYENNVVKAWINLKYFNLVKLTEDSHLDKNPNHKQVLLKYIDEKYKYDDFLKYLISLV